KRPAAEDVEMDLLDKQQLELDRQFNVLSQRKYDPTMDDWLRHPAGKTVLINLTCSATEAV
ncbi:hypothetical protein FRB90_009831, partial [Tulasnella sp. 427]